MYNNLIENKKKRIKSFNGDNESMKEPRLNGGLVSSSISAEVSEE